MEFVEYIKTPMCPSVKLLQPPWPQLEGTLCITGHHFIFSTRQKEDDELWILHRIVDTIERKQCGMMGGSIIVRCKDFRVLQIDIRDIEEFNNVAYSLEMLSSIEDLRVAYPFFYRASSTAGEEWFELAAEEQAFNRKLLHKDWRISRANDDFSLCDSYPRTVIVPESILDEQLKQVAVFRQGGRFPILCYRHEKGSVLLRSSQPMIGNQRRCREDERLLNAALTLNQKGYIIDTRPQSLALSAKNRGGGYEPEAFYPRWRRVHKPIDRHATQLESLHILISCVYEAQQQSVETSATSAVSADGTASSKHSVSYWLQHLINSNWLSHVKDTLNCACLVAQCLNQECASVLVHGADGMDSTLQVSALAQLILDAECRTVRGFLWLVEREWIRAGHPFSTRHRHSVFAPMATRDRAHGAAPSFLLFLDCVWQLTVQFSTSFQFNDTLLLLLFQHAYGSQYGTFLGDSACERQRLSVQQRTCSLWSSVIADVDRFTNPLYMANRRVVWPSVAPMSIHLWHGMYLRWTTDLQPQRRALLRVHELLAEHGRLCDKANRLRLRLAELSKQASSRGLIPPSTPLQEPSP